MVDKAKCLCKSVTVSVENMSDSIGACHCDMCRKWSGGPYLSVDCGNQVTFDGTEHIGEYQSSDWAARGFCTNCGTHLYYKMMENSQYIIPIGLFNKVEGKTFDHQIFIDEKPEYYDFSNPTKNMTGAEVFAAFAPK